MTDSADPGFALLRELGQAQTPNERQSRLAALLAHPNPWGDGPLLPFLFARAPAAAVKCLESRNLHPGLLIRLEPITAAEDALLILTDKAAEITTNPPGFLWRTMWYRLMQQIDELEKDGLGFKTDELDPRLTDASTEELVATTLEQAGFQNGDDDPVAEEIAAALNEQQRAHLRSALDEVIPELPRALREVAEGIYREDKTREHIAAELHLTPNAMRQRVFRLARELPPRLRQALRDRGVL